MLRTRLQTGVFKTLMLDIMAPEAHQSDCNYVHELSRPPLCKNLAWWVVTQRTSKTTKLSKLGPSHLCGDGHLPRDNTVSSAPLHLHTTAWPPLLSLKVYSYTTLLQQTFKAYSRYNHLSCFKNLGFIIINFIILFLITECLKNLHIVSIFSCKVNW